MKMDCEGAEYKIVERLRDCNLLYELSFLMVEWHNTVEGADSSDLTRILMENGFGVVERNRGEIAGMM